MPKNPWSILIALSLAACGTGPLPEAESADPHGLLRACWYWYDGDGDGFGGASRVRTPGCLQPPGYVRNPLDCDDASAAVHPGAFEVCNDADDDCDGDVDLYALDEQVWYRDADGDGFGRWALTQLDCDQPVGYAATYGDCADTDPSRNPGATETCNGVDDDCDGHTDDNDPDTVGQTWWFEDLDGDGYGTPASAVLACASGGGAPTADDCDDTDAGRSPGAAEVCADGIDQDCDGSDSAVCPSCALDPNERTVLAADGTIVAPGLYEIGVDMSVGDVDGDGWDELLVSNASESAFGVNAGAVWAVPPVFGVESTTGDAVATLHGADPEDRAVTSAVGDVDGDGFDDVVIGAVRSGFGGAASQSGTVHLVLGPVTGIIDLTDSDTTWVGEYTGGFWGSVAGTAVAVVGDQTGDGLPDVAAGDNRTWALNGATYVMAGTDRGTIGLGSVYARRVGSASDRLSRVMGSVDLNSDGVDDLVYSGTDDNDNPAADGGAMYVEFGPVSGQSTASAADLTILGNQPYDYLGTSVAPAGDVDGDGVGDVLATAPGEDGAAGATYVFTTLGSGSGTLGTAHARLTGEAVNDGSGSFAVALGDVDHDGLDDVAVAAVRADSCGVDSGAVYLLSGPVGEVSLVDAEVVFVGEPGQRLGFGLVAHDFDGDGVMDLAIGDAPTTGDPGRVHLIRGPLF